MKRTLPLLALAALLAGGCALLAPRAESFASLLARAEAGDAEAQHQVGKRYANGVGVETNDTIAVEWYRRAAEQGSASAEYSLGWCYHLGSGVEQDDATAFEWMKKAADHGLPIACFLLGTMYHEGTGVETNGAEALRWYRKAAGSDDERARVFAQNGVGRCYSDGVGVKQDDKEAAAWFRKAAEAGNPVAMVNLSMSYARGRGVEEDRQAARDWWAKSLEVPSDHPWYGAGVQVQREYDRKLHEIVQNGPKNPAERLWAAKTILHGHPETDFDPEPGLRLLREGAEAGELPVQKALASLCSRGLPGAVEKDTGECVRWLRRGAESGDPWSQKYLAYLLVHGWGDVKKNPREAAFWLRKAGEAGDEESAKFLDWLERNEPKAAAEATHAESAEPEFYAETAEGGGGSGEAQPPPVESCAEAAP